MGWNHQLDNLSHSLLGVIHPRFQLARFFSINSIYKGTAHPDLGGQVWRTVTLAIRLCCFGPQKIISHLLPGWIMMTCLFFGGWGVREEEWTWYLQKGSFFKWLFFFFWALTPRFILWWEQTYPGKNHWTLVLFLGLLGNREVFAPHVTYIVIPYHPINPGVFWWSRRSMGFLGGGELSRQFCRSLCKYSQFYSQPG